MAWDFAAEIHSLANYDADDASTTGTSGEVLSAHATQWLTDGAKEIISQLPSNLLQLCATNTTFTSQAAGSETSASLLNTGKVLNVFAGSYSCRLISNTDKYKAEDSDNVLYATATDPAYYIERSYINVLPSGISTSRYEEVQYPTVAYSDTAIALFPDEAEYLVVLYAATKACLYQMNTFQTDTDIDTTAFTAINTELDETQAVCDSINTQADSAVTALSNMATEIGLANDEVDLANPEVDLAKAEILETVTLIDTAIDTAATAINTAVGKVNAQIVLASTEFDLVNPEVDLANAEVDLEDMEKAQGYIQTAQGYSQAGSNYLQEAQGQLNEVSGYVNEINVRVAQVNGQIAVATGYLATASGYNQVGQAYLGTAGAYGNQASGFLSAAQGFANEIQTKIAIANGYIAEVQSRMGRATQKYTWYDGQYAKLSAEYARGLAVLKGTTGGGGT